MSLDKNYEVITNCRHQTLQQTYKYYYALEI